MPGGATEGGWQVLRVSTGRASKCRKIGQRGCFWIGALEVSPEIRGTWPKRPAMFPATSCSAARFVDKGNGTVTDKLTGDDHPRRRHDPAKFFLSLTRVSSLRARAG